MNNRILSIKQKRKKVNMQLLKSTTNNIKKPFVNKGFNNLFLLKYFYEKFYLQTFFIFQNAGQHNSS